MEDAHAASLNAAKLPPTYVCNAHFLAICTAAFEFSWLRPCRSEPAKSDPDNPFAFFAIFDGHGGPKAAEFTATNLLPFLQDEKLKVLCCIELLGLVFFLVVFMSGLTCEAR